MCLKFPSEISILGASNLLIPQSTENEHFIKLENNISDTNYIPNDFPQMYQAFSDRKGESKSKKESFYAQHTVSFPPYDSITKTQN